METYQPINITDVQNLVGKCCFNGSLFASCVLKGSSKPTFTNFISKDVSSCKIFFVYRSTPSISEGYKSSLHLTRVSLKTGIADISTNTTLFKDLQYEDPRVLCCDEKVFVSFSKVLTRNPISIEINGVYLDNDLKLQCDPERHETFTTFPINTLSKTQKNWTFFKELGVFHIIYNIMPFEIYLWDEGNECVLLMSRSWHHPMKPNLRLRGGAPPVKVDNVYYAFVHSTDYEVYCITFHPTTFELMKVSRDPILINRGKKKDIHFPCGTLWNSFESTFYVSLGVDDVKLCFFSIEKDNLDSQLVDAYLSSPHLEISECFTDDFVWINSWGGGADHTLISHLGSQVKCRNTVWDRVGCHFPYYLPTESKKIYVVQNPLASIAKMLMTRTQHCNLCKLSNQPFAQFSLTSLIYFMSKQYDEWVEIEREDVLVTYCAYEMNLKLIYDWLDLESERADYTIAISPRISEGDLDSLRRRIAREGGLGILLLDQLHQKILQRFPDCLQ